MKERKPYVEKQQNFRIQHVAMLKSVRKVLLIFFFFLENFHGDRTARFYHQIFIIWYA
jgi:hypothetical protein